MTISDVLFAFLQPVKMPTYQYPCSLVAQFTEDIYKNAGASDVLPLVMKTLNAEKVLGVQFLRSGRVRITFDDPETCSTVLKDGLDLGDVTVQLFPADDRVGGKKLNLPCSFLVCRLVFVGLWCRNVSIVPSCPFNMSQLFPKSILLQFPSEIYLRRGVGELFSLLVRALHEKEIIAVQFLRGFGYGSPCALRPTGRICYRLSSVLKIPLFLLRLLIVLPIQSMSVICPLKSPTSLLCLC